MNLLSATHQTLAVLALLLLASCSQTLPQAEKPTPAQKTAQPAAPSPALSSFGPTVLQQAEQLIQEVEASP